MLVSPLEPDPFLMFSPSEKTIIIHPVTKPGGLGSHLRVCLLFHHHVQLDASSQDSTFSVALGLFPPLLPIAPLTPVWILIIFP